MNALGKSVDDHLRTPPNLAAQTGNEAPVRLLLRHHASLKSRDMDGRGRLHNAITVGNRYFFFLRYSVLLS